MTVRLILRQQAGADQVLDSILEEFASAEKLTAEVEKILVAVLEKLDNPGPAA